MAEVRVLDESQVWTSSHLFTANEKRKTAVQYRQCRISKAPLEILLTDMGKDVLVQI